MKPDISIEASMVLSHLTDAEATAVPITVLAFYVPPRRAVEAAVEELRRAGYPVAAGRWGLWLERDPLKYAANVERRRSRAIHMLANVAAEMRTVQILAGQAEAGL